MLQDIQDDSGENISGIKGRKKPDVAELLNSRTRSQSIAGRFTRWAAAAVVVSIPISILFIIMQRFYVDGLTGAVKG